MPYWGGGEGGCACEGLGGMGRGRWGLHCIRGRG